MGITTKVIKGSFWTLGGQVLPLLASLLTTPFVIRLLGTESYGAYVLIALIPGYFTFADFGMSIGSTKFGSQAYARGSREDEAKIVRTAGLIAFLTSFTVAVGISILSSTIIVWLNVPEHLRGETIIALRIASLTFVLNILCNILNTPQLSRLRMDLNTFVNTGFRLLGILTIPAVLYLGGGIIGATTILMIASFLTLLGHLFVSGRLLGEIFQFSIDRDIVKPLLKFGGSLMMAGIAAILLTNLEKIVLVRVASVEALAYYSVAFTLASMTTMLSSAMVQSLLPAFSQLITPEKQADLNNLFSRSLRINIIGLLPMVMLLFVVAKPFFTIWAGENFGRESSLPFYILLFGVFFNIIAYIPHSVLMASGKAGIFAKIYWIELLPYILTIAFLTYNFGAVGAAFAWSLRVISDASVIIWFAVKKVGVSFDIFNGKGKNFSLSSLILLPPIIFAYLIGDFSIWLLFLLPFCLVVYFLTVWKNFLESEEKTLLITKLYGIFNRQNSVR